ncbi:MAG: ADP-ribosylglycohydrolase family protein [Anaerolineae bacterium]|nr:ADP-ribosylglycohydrolase family protein [Anaerolineae bacterium]
MSDSPLLAILYGLALGDAMGWPVEFVSSVADIKRRYPPNGITQPPDPALFTDDTQMTLALCEGLLAAGINASVEQITSAIGEHFLIWKRTQSIPSQNRAPGGTVMGALNSYVPGMNWRELGIAASKGCGAAMRVGPLGYVYQHQPARLKEIAIAQAEITHRHPTALASAVAAAYAVKLALDHAPLSQFISNILEFVDGISEEMDAALFRIGHVLGWVNEEDALKHIGEGWIGEEAVALALYCVLRYPDDYAACMWRAANTSGDSDSIACIAGGILGARLGIHAVPESWIARLERRLEIANLAEKLTRPPE